MATASDKPFVLVDGSSYLYRAFHALPPLLNSQGEPTGAIYGVINMLRKLLEDYEPDCVGVIFDPKGKTFRDDLYSEYKANRPPMPDDLRSQIQPLFEIIKAMGLPLIIIDGFEADDVIGTLALRATEQGMKTIISTGDKDMAQLVNEHVTLINTMTNTLMDEVGVDEKFGVPPKLIIDYLTLIGDTVDNVPGVPKVGPKTAVKWLTQYGSLDEIMAHADEFKGKVGEYLRESLEQLPLSRDLVTIRLDVEIPLKPLDMKPTKADTAALADLYQRFEFKRWLKETTSEDEAPVEKSETHYDTILTEAALSTWIDRLKKASLFAFDTETTSLNYMEAKVVGVSFSDEPGRAAYLPFGHDYEDAPKQLSEETVFKALKPLLEDPSQKKIGHNLKYDKSVLANHGVNLQGIEFDTMLESFVLASSSRHDMDRLALKHLAHQTTHFEDVAGKGAKQITFNQVPLELASPYAAEDADITLKLHKCFWPMLAKEKGLISVFSEIEMPLLPILSKVERTGVLVDADLLLKQSEELAKRIENLENKVYELSGKTFNLASTKQLQEILYEDMGLPILKKTPKGQPSTAEPVLQELAHDYELPKLILEFRSLSKLKSTYTDRLPEQVSPTTGRVHTSYHQAGAATGRFSSSDPNLQNIPIRHEEGRRIRQAFIAPKGYKIVAADYSQVELRIMAHLSGDKSLLDAFANGLDIHRATAAEIFGVTLDEVSTEQRRHAKAVNFGLIYGMSAFGLAKQLDLDRGAAQGYMDMYFARYPGVKTYMDEICKQAREKGYVETLFGRRLYLPDINASNKQRQLAAERTAVNAPMQGTAADIIKRAMVRVDDWLTKEGIDAKMIMQVHDELVFEVAEDHVAQLSEGVKAMMSGAADLKVPLVVDVGVGDNWDEAH